jgi:NADPH-dependent 2,4-dienoyl-CoA reductase/sulfur reductase-like enzyme
MAERLVVIGGDAAGMSAASQARRRRTADQLEIVAFERGQHTSYSACGIPYLVGGVIDDVDLLVTRAPEVFRREYAIDVRLGHEVTAIDLDRREVTAWDRAAGTERREGFDQLVVATGAVPIRPPLPGADARGIHGVQVLDDGVVLRDLLADEKPARAVVVGGGYIGLEMAEALVLRGIDVSVVELGPHPMGTLDPDMGGLVTDALRGLGIAVFEREGVTGFDVEGGRVTAVVTSARTLPAELVILGLGARPNVALAQDAGIPLGLSGGIAVDQCMRARSEGVWAAGDCVESYHRVSQRPVVIALGTHANKQGRVAGINIGGGYATFPGVVGTAATKVCDYEVARTGLNEREAITAGFQYVTAVVDSTTRAGYFPGSNPIKIKLLAERRSGRLLGGQIIGREGAAKRIDVIATALWNEMTVHDMLNLDLSYAPPFAPTWDPVLIAARKAAEAVEETLSECR